VNAPSSSPAGEQAPEEHMNRVLADELGDALHQTRMIRFGLEAAWSAIDALPDEMAPTDDVRTALRTIADWLGQAEAGELHGMLTARAYTVIRPVSLLNPPPAEDMAAITTAITVLSTHGLVITEG
jgi:hypothetical protein